MDVVKIVFVSAIIFPILATAAVMCVVRYCLVRRKKESEEMLKEKLRYADQQELIQSMENVIDAQDKVLGEYRAKED